MFFYLWKHDPPSGGVLPAPTRARAVPHSADLRFSVVTTPTTHAVACVFLGSLYSFRTQFTVEHHTCGTARVLPPPPRSVSGLASVQGWCSD